MKRLFLAFLGLLWSLLAGAQTPAQALRNHVNELARKEPLKSASWGMKAVDGAGNTLVEYNSGKRLVPASNLKLVTTGVALHTFGPGHRFRTDIAYSGEVDSLGILHGDLYILGGGDPTLFTSDSIATPRQQLLRQWAASVRQAGIRRIEGFVIGDGRYFDGPQECSSWNYDDIGFAYGTGGNALSYHANSLDITVAPGRTVGDSVRIVSIYPETPWMDYRFLATTAARGTGDQLYYFTSDLAPVGELRGSFAIDRKSKVEKCSNKFGDLSCAAALCLYLSETAQVPVTRGPARIDRSGALQDADFYLWPDAVLPRDSLRILSSAYSPELGRIAFATNHRSDNFYAESLFRHLGIHGEGSAQYAAGSAAEGQLLSALGMGKSGLRIADGSGLSRLNYVTPAWLVAYLRVMQKSRVWEAFLHSLPHPGSNGTLKSLLPQADAALKRRIFMKSGSMDGVLCYSGYILSADGDPDKTICFSILTNHSVVPTQEMRTALMGIISRLAAVNG